MAINRTATLRKIAKGRGGARARQRARHLLNNTPGGRATTDIGGGPKAVDISPKSAINLRGGRVVTNTDNPSARVPSVNIQRRIELSAPGSPIRT